MNKQSDTTNLSALKMLAEESIASGDYPMALKYYTYAIDMDPANNEILQKLHEVSRMQYQGMPLFTGQKFELEENETIIYSKSHSRQYLYCALFFVVLNLSVFLLYSLIFVVSSNTSNIDFHGWVKNLKWIAFPVEVILISFLLMSVLPRFRVMLTNKRLFVFRPGVFPFFFQTRLSMILETEYKNSLLSGFMKLNSLKIAIRTIRSSPYILFLSGVNDLDSIYRELKSANSSIPPNKSLPIHPDFSNASKILIYTAIGYLLLIILLLALTALYIRLTLF